MSENALAVLAGGMLGLRTYLVDANEDTRRAVSFPGARDGAGGAKKPR